MINVGFMADKFKSKANVIIFHIYHNVVIEKWLMVLLILMFVSFLDTKIAFLNFIMHITF